MRPALTRQNAVRHIHDIETGPALDIANDTNHNINDIIHTGRCAHCRNYWGIYMFVIAILLIVAFAIAYFIGDITDFIYAVRNYFTIN